MNSGSKMTEAVPTPPSITKVGVLESKPDLSNFPGTLFRLLEELDLCYCLLVDPYKETCGGLVSRLEMTVGLEDRARLPLLVKRLREEGYRPLQCLPLAANDYRYDFAISVDAGLHFICLTVREGFPSGLLFTSDKEVLTRRQRRGQCWVACEEDEFCYLLSKASLEGTVTEPQQVRFKQLVQALGPPRVEELAARFFGDGRQQQVLAACARGQWDGILESLGAHLRWARFRRAPLCWVVHVLLQFRCALRRWLRPSGLYIVMLGPDGAGKSTLTGKILELLGPLFHCQRILQWRPQVLKPRPRYIPGFNPPHAKPPYGIMRSMVHILAVLADYWLGYPAVIRPLLTRNALIVYDRDFHDLLVDRLRYRYGGPDWFPQVAIRLCPEPETLFLTLDADPDVILNRKNEVAPNELRRQRRAYLELAANLANSTVVRTDQGLEAGTSAAMKAVLTYMAGRFERRQRRLWTRGARQTNGQQATSEMGSSNARQ